MFYSIRHLTKFHYSAPVSESAMECRMHPRSENNQRCLNLQLSVSPRCRLFTYRDYLGNQVHHFDIPIPHEQLVIVAESLVEMQAAPEIPPRLPEQSWDEVDRLAKQEDCWEMLLPSEFAVCTPLLEELKQQMALRRQEDPLTVLKEMNEYLYNTIEYVPRSTEVNSPIDEALRNRKGVCQDFAHIMIALVRGLGIPCRYVSGYMYQRKQNHVRSSANATHAWVEALLPHLGWVGFDPTNCLIASEQHIRTAIGRDYADVPPTKGIFRGQTASELTVAVQVGSSAEAPSFDQKLPIPEDWSMLIDKAAEPSPASATLAQMRQQQQQQQQQ